MPNDQPHRRGFVYSPHGNIEYREAGEGPALVLLHLNTSSAAMYIPYFPLLSGHVRAISMSAMGYGESDRPPKPYTTLHEFAQAVVWLLDGLGLETASIFGLLTGSMIATEVGAGWPNRVDKLILQEVFNWNTPQRRAVQERVHSYHPEKKDGSHLVEMWQRAANAGTAERDAEAVRQRFLDRFRLNSNEGVEEFYGDMGWEGAGPYAMCRYEIWERAP